MDPKIKELFRFAIEQEKKANHTYKVFAKQASKKSLKELFNNLAKEEENHKKLLKKMNLNKVDIKVNSKIKSTSLVSGLDEYNISLKDAKEINDALNFAIKQEEDAYNMYKILLESASLGDYKIVVEEIAKQEVIHKTKLLDIKESFNFKDWNPIDLM